MANGKSSLGSMLWAIGVRSNEIISAMNSISRADLVSGTHSALAKSVGVLPLPKGQYVQHQYSLAQILEAGELDGRAGLNVLVIGAGSMYSSLVLRKLGCRITAFERQPEIAKRGQETLGRLDMDNIELLVGNGLDGLPRSAPYDRIFLFGSCENIRPKLFEQLAEDGWVVVPVDEDGAAKILKRHKNNETQTIPLFEQFTPLEDSLVTFNPYIA